MRNSATIIEIEKKVVEFDNKKEIYNNGEDNQYPERIERLIKNSVTAKTASGIMQQYLVGFGFGETDNLIVNKFKNTKLIDFTNQLVKSKVNQKGYFIHVNWNANFKIKDMQVLPFTSPRVGRIDDLDYNGKIIVHKNWIGKIENEKTFNVYNPDPEIIEAQVRKASGNLKKTLTASDWAQYKGQILYVNDDYDYIYPDSRIDAVKLDCDNEHLITLYKNTILRDGFFGKTLVITRPLIGDVTELVYNSDNIEIRNPLYAEAETERENFKDTIKSFLGAKNVDGVLHLELEFDHEKLEDAILFKNIESNINPDMFEKIEVSVRKNILIAFNNLPVGLVQSSEGLFSAGADALLQMEKAYFKNTQTERDSLQTQINDLLARFEGYTGGYVELKPLIKQATNEEGADSEASRFAEFGVGGVQGILSIQQSFSEQKTTFESAITILVKIYGFNRQVSSALLGRPELE